MNVSSLRQAVRDWGGIIGALDVVRTEYLRRHPAAPANLVEYWRLLTAASLLPAYFTFRDREPIADGRIPAFAGSINKMMGGIMSVCGKLALAEMAEGRAVADVLVTPRLILEAAETTGSLIGASEVCAAPATMLEEVLTVISHGAGGKAVDRGPIRALLPDPEAFLDYAEASAELTLVLFVLSLKIGAALARLEPPSANRFFQTYTLGLPIEAALGDELALAFAPLLRSDISALLRSDISALLRSDISALLEAPEPPDAEALRVVNRLRARIHAALGRPPASRDLEGADLSALFGDPPTHAAPRNGAPS
jgi:hypothetical protein